MDQVTPKPLEDDVDSPKSSSSADSVDVNPLLDVSPPQEPETNDSGPESDENSSEIEDETSSHPNSNVSSIPNPSVGAGEPTEIPLLDNPVSEPISPAEAALEVIKNQYTHCLYCSICKSNITKDAVLFKKREEPYPYNTAPYVLWLPRLNLSWIRRFNPSWSPRDFKDLTLPSPWFLLVVVLVLSINVMWFQHSPVTPPGPPSHEEPFNHSLVTPLGPPSHVAPPPGSPPHVPPPPGPSPFVTPPGPPFPRPPPGPGPYEKIRWLIHFLSRNYLSIFSLLFLAILALRWPSISTSIDSLRKAAIERCRGMENPFLPLCRDIINSLKALVTPNPNPKPNPDPEPKLEQKPEPKPNPDPKLEQKPDPKPQPNPNPDPTPPAISIIRKIVDLGRHIVDRLGNLDILKSIVYGGLIESITSLGVVSSAAASGATTLNVLALGVTSLFSGFILMAYSLRELVAKHKKAEEKAKKDPKQQKKETQYQTQLGNYGNVILHCVVVLASFLVFGLIPPLCYGLFFRETDKGHYKAALVLVVSLICVILLSSAKVYAFRMEKKLRTVWEYTGMAVAASALSFITSQIFSDMLEKYGFRKPASD